MGDNAEEQEQELEVLESIFFDTLEKVENGFEILIKNEGAEDEEATGKNSIKLGVQFPAEYPSDEIPVFSLENYHNRHLVPSTRDNMSQALNEEARTMLGGAMVYTLVEWLKSDLLRWGPLEDDGSANERKVPEKQEITQKKEKLSKNQKRKLAGRVDENGELPRGWDWVDLVSHLSKTADSK